MYRVFVVEDDPVIAGAICAQMDSWGLEARCAKDFGAVMAEFAAFDPQLVLLDISLPATRATTGAPRYGRSPRCR